MPNPILSRRDAGFSIVELLIVLVILGIVASLAILAMGRSSKIIDRENIAKELKVALERSRFDSVKRRPQTCADMSRVEIVSPTSFRYITDMNQDGRLQPAAESRVVEFAGRSEVRIVGTPPPTFPIVIRFDQRGNTTSGPCGTEIPTETPTNFCERNCGTLTAANTTSVYVSPTGTVAMLQGGEAVPTFANPAVSNVATDNGINPYLAVWTGTPPTPTPVGTPSGSPIPTATPTPIPTPTGSVTPTPTPVGSPTPLPNCTRNQRPGNPPICHCPPPWNVQGNGQCK
jgi:prepilin-type N-terminal cleavage/methylation domain-containing protein